MPKLSATCAVRVVPTGVSALVWVVLALLTVLLGGCNPPGFYTATEAELDLSEWEIDHPAMLGGDWRAIDDLDERWIETRLPASATIFPMGADWRALVGGRYGCATYELDLQLPDTARPYTFLLPFAGSAYELWADGVPVLQAGTVACGREDIEPDFGRQTGEVELAGDVRLVVRVASYYHEPGGPLIAPRIGDPSQITRSLAQRDFINMLSFGGILFIGLYHLIVWWLRREDMAGFWFGVLCTLVVMRIPAMEMFLQRSTVVGHYPLVTHFSYFTLYAGLPVIAWYVHSSSRTRAGSTNSPSPPRPSRSSRR